MRALRIVLAVAFVASLGLTACGPREHLTDNYGKVLKTQFEAQRVFAEPATDTVGGLDSEEAAVIHAQYRKQMGGAPAAGRQEPAQVLVLEKPRGKK